MAYRLAEAAGLKPREHVSPSFPYGVWGPPQDPGKPAQKYGYGISQISFGPNTVYFHGGETPGYNSFIGHDLTNQVTLVVWTNLTVSLDGSPTANAIMVKVLDQIYVVSPVRPPPSPTATPWRMSGAIRLEGS